MFERVEERVQQAEERHRMLFDSVPIPTVVHDTETLRILAVNEAAVRAYGWSREEWLSLTLLELRVGEPEAVRGGLRALGPGVETVTGVQHRKKGGSVIEVEVVTYPLELGGRPARISLVQDVTARKRLEEHLQQAQKLDAIGSLAGGVAHDFNNILSIILSYSSMLLESVKPDDAMRADLEEIHQAAQRASDLTRQLLAFGRRQILQPRPLRLDTIVLDMEKMIRRVLREDVELTIVPAADLGSANVDPSQLEQVILNLVVNARDAMSRGGKLTIETFETELDEAHARELLNVTPGRYIVLAVSDTGVGMDKATQARIFEPFFTTKRASKGTGLGLSTVFGIVSQSGGHVTVESEPGCGTVFKVYFPRVEAANHSSLAPSPKLAGGTETVLVAEDEGQVRALICNILRRQGYTVLEASSGAEALRVCEGHRAKIDLLVADVVMPKMSGRQLADHLESTRPETKVLFMSGYSDESIMHHLQPGDSSGVKVELLHKPITPESLARRVREVLDAPNQNV